MSNKLRRTVSVMTAIIAVALLTTTVTLANGVPVRLFLNYLPDTSNWGPQTANGSAMVGVGDGFVQLSVTGLSHLDGERYTAWLLPQDGSEWVRVGTFSIDETGAGDFGWTPEVFPYQEYHLMVVTVEPDPDSDGKPDSRISLVGHFPNSEAILTAPASSSAARESEVEERPARLPVTGGVLQPPTVREMNLPTTLALFLTAVLWLVIGLGGWWVTRRRKTQ